MAVVDEKIADFTVDNYAAVKLEHPQRETCSVPDPTDIDYFSTSKFFVHKDLMSFPKCSSTGLDGILPPISKDLAAKSNGRTRLIFLRTLTTLLNVILEGKVPFELRWYFFGAKLIAAKKARWRTSFYRCRQYFPPVARKMCRIPCLRITSSKIWKSKSKCRHQNGR